MTLEQINLKILAMKAALVGSRLDTFADIFRQTVEDLSPAQRQEFFRMWNVVAEVLGKDPWYRHVVCDRCGDPIQVGEGKRVVPCDCHTWKL